MKSWWENVSSDLFSEIKVQRSAEPIKNHQELLISARFLYIEVKLVLEVFTGSDWTDQLTKN